MSIPAKVRIWRKSRRVGISWAIAGDCSLDAAAEDGCNTTYIGYDRLMTTQFIQDAAAWAKAYNLVVSDIEETVFVDEDKDILAFSLRFASGKTITALSSKPRNLRSRKGRVVLDEYAFHDDPEALLKAALALTVWGGRIDIISSVNGLCEHFEELCGVIASERGYSVQTITFDDAIADGLYKRICLVNGEDWSQKKQDEWRAKIILEYGLGADEELFCKANRRKGTPAFNHFDRTSHVRAVAFDRLLPLHLSFDFNRSPATCAIGQTDRANVRILEEIYLLNSDTFALGRSARAIIDQLQPYLTYIHGDASGRAMTANSQQSNWDIISNALAGLPLNWQVPTCNPPIADTLNSANSLLHQGRVAIDPGCKELIKDLETVKLDSQGKLDKKADPLRCQVVDGFRYLCFDLFPLQTAGARGAIVGGSMAKVKF